MVLDNETRQRIESLIGSDRVVLFMKGTRQTPMCGFSATTVSILDSLVPEYTTFNVLEDQSVREGVKAFSNWPTIPQLYVDKEFVGGCDIVKQMLNSGELHQTLGLGAPDRSAPEITISDEAAETFIQALESNPGHGVHLTIDSAWQHQFSLGPVEGHEIAAESNGVTVLMDLATAPKANGLLIDMVDSVQGRGFKIDNPNAARA